MGNHMVLQQNSSVKLLGVGQTAKSNRHYFVEQPDLSGIYRQRWGLVKVDTPKGGYTPYSITISSGAPVTLSEYTDRGGMDLFRTVEHGNAHDGKCRTAHDNSLEVLLNSGNYRDRIRFLLPYREPMIQNAARILKKKKMGSIIT